MQKEMFKGQANSPIAKLSTGIDATTTTITVDDVNKLPDAPNVVSIGNGRDVETIKYTGKNVVNNTLTGVTRGFQGVAQSWLVNTNVSRNFTAYDYDTLVDNVNDLSTGKLDKSGGTITGDIIPATANAITLGSEAKPFKDVFIGPNSLYVDGNKVLSSTSNTLDISTDPDQHMSVNTTGLGTTRVASGKEVILYSADVINIQAIGNIKTLTDGTITHETSLTGGTITFNAKNPLSDINFTSAGRMNFTSSDINFSSTPQVNNVDVSLAGHTHSQYALATDLSNKVDVGSVYLTGETYSRNETYSRDEVYTKTEVDDAIAAIPTGGGGSTGVIERRIARYVHSGNSVIQAASVDPTTGIFTTTQSMGWVAGTIYNSIIVSYVNGLPTKLFSEWNGTNSYGLKVIDANTFYIVNGSSSNAVVTYAAGQGIDLTKIQFEYNCPAPPNLDLTGITTGDKIRITWRGIKNRPGYVILTPNWSYTGGTGSQTTNAMDGRTFQIGYLEINCEYNREMALLQWWAGRTMTYTWSGGTAWTANNTAGAERAMFIAPNLTFTRINLGTTGAMANNTVVEVFGTY